MSANVIEFDRDRVFRSAGGPRPTASVDKHDPLQLEGRAARRFAAPEASHLTLRELMSIALAAETWD